MAVKKKDTARAISTRENERQAKELNKVMQERYVVEELERENEKLKNYITEMQSELDGYKLGAVLNETNDDVSIKILEFRAKNYSPDTIQEKMKYLKIEIDVKAIEEIINNIESLSPALQVAYTKACEQYEESIKINPSILKQSNLIENQFCIDEIKKMIQISTDEDKKANLFDRLDRYINTKTKLLGEVVLKDESGAEGTEYVRNMKDRLKQRSEKRLEGFNPEGLRVV